MGKRRYFTAARLAAGILCAGTFPAPAIPTSATPS
jgi:hypothetical protein